MARVNFKSRVKFESGSKLSFCFFFLVFFSDYTNDVRAVTRNINFPVGDIFDRKSHYRCVSPLLHQDTRQLSILIHFFKNSKASNLPIPEEHVPLIPDIPEKQTVKGVEARNI